MSPHPNLYSEVNSDLPEEDQLLRDAATLRELLVGPSTREWPQGWDCPFLLVLSGLPGTGKTHFARELVKSLPMLVLESDHLRKALIPSPKYTRGEHSRVFAACHFLVEEFLAQGWRVLFDAANLTETHRQPLYYIASRTSSPAAVVWFAAPRETIRRRLAERAAGLDPGNYLDAGWLVHSRLSVGEEPIQRQHFTVDSSSDIGPVLEEIVRLVQTGAETDLQLS